MNVKKGCDMDVMTSSDDVSGMKSTAAGHQTTALLSTPCPVYRHQQHHSSCCNKLRLPPSAPAIDTPLTPTRTVWQPCQQFSDVIVRVNGTDNRPRCSTCAVMTSLPPPTYDESLFHCNRPYSSSHVTFEDDETK